MCSLCSESNNTICFYARSLVYLLERLFGFTYQVYFALQHGGVFLVTIDSDVTSPHLYKRFVLLTFVSSLPFGKVFYSSRGCLIIITSANFVSNTNG